MPIAIFLRLKNNVNRYFRSLGKKFRTIEKNVSAVLFLFFPNSTFEPLYTSHSSLITESLYRWLYTPSTLNGSCTSYVLACAKCTRRCTFEISFVYERLIISFSYNPHHRLAEQCQLQSE